MALKELILQEIDKIYDSEAPKHDQQCDFEDGYFTGISTISNLIDSLPEEDASCTYDTNELTPTPSVNIEDVARVQFASHAHVFDRKRKAVFDWEQFKEVVGIFYGFGKKDSLPEEKPIEKDAKMEALIACDIIEATVKRVNIDKQDKDKEEEAMLEKINYLRNLGLNE